ncbi:hypothetical protein GcC1_024021, partial [Golovinomyces cichoracearum]
ELQLEVRSTYLSENAPSDVLLSNHYVNESPRNPLINAPTINIVSKASTTIPSSQPAPEIRLPERSGVPKIVPKILAVNPTMSQTTTMASIEARNAPPTGKKIEWTTVSRNGPKKKDFNIREKWPG